MHKKDLHLWRDRGKRTLLLLMSRKLVVIYTKIMHLDWIICVMQAVQEIRQLEDGMFVTLSEQTTAEKSTAKTTADIRQLKKTIREEEMGVVNSQNELAKLQVGVSQRTTHCA